MRPVRSLLTLAAFTLALACRQDAPARGRTEKAEKAEKPEEVTKVSTGAKGKAKDEVDLGDAPVAAGEPKGDGQPMTLFIIMDTVRADHTALCGYDRPNTPFLQTLRDRTKVAVSCDAHAPGPWTVPSHASYFTGLTVPEHGSDAMGIKFDRTIPTLADVMRGKGYQAVMLSANPTLSKESGLQRGFETINVASTLTDMRGEDFKRELRKVVSELDPKKPLFFFVNLIDAHDPYPEIPEGIDWVPAQKSLAYNVHDVERDTPYHKYFKGELTPEREREYEEFARNGYDYGISLVDDNVRTVLQTLRREGWMGHGFRMVITSDHGEFLGEHHLLRHGCYIWEPVTRVPFLWYDSASKGQQITLPSPFSSLNAFWLLSEGKLPDAAVPVTSFSNRRENDIKVGADMAALWTSPTEKLVWNTDSYLRFDLAADPGEKAPQPLPADHPQRPILEKMAADHQAHLVKVRAQDVDPALQAQLEKLGYWENTEAGTPKEVAPPK